MDETVHTVDWAALVVGNMPMSVKTARQFGRTQEGGSLRRATKNVAETGILGVE